MLNKTLPSRCARIWLVVGLALAAIAALACWPRIPQDPAYHQFADRRIFLGIPRAIDVLSNLAFVFAGAAGLRVLFRSQAPVAFVDARERWAFAVLFAGTVLVGLGSAWYHLAPDNSRLVWDRLPMTIGIMGLVAAVISERINDRAGRLFLPALLLLGAASVIWWVWTERRGAGDLRWYAFVQFYPVFLLPLLIALFPARYTRTSDYFVLFGFYVAAKVAEYLDAPILDLGNVVSGHTLKHILAAAGVLWIARMLARRKPVNESVS